MNDKINKNIIGTKAYNLIALKEKGFNVPNFCIIDSVIINKYFSCIKNRIVQVFNNEESSIDICSKYIFKMIDTVRDENIETDIKDRISTSFSEEEFFSVRTSEVNEDIEFFNGGQFKNYLYIKRENIIKYIKECYKSLYSVDMLKYYKKNKRNLNELKIAVIIQEMISSENFGVAFSSNPNGMLNEMVILTGIGVGESSEDDDNPFTKYYYNKDNKAMYYEVYGKSPLLDKKILNNLVSNIYKMEEMFNQSVSVEWGVKSDKIYFLQVRPVLNINNNEEIIVLDNNNTLEEYLGVVLPLTSSFIITLYSKFFKSLVKDISKDEKFITNYNLIFDNIISYINGRLYFNVNNLYVISKLLLINEEVMPIYNKRRLENGLKQKIDEKYNLKLGFSDRAKIGKNLNNLLKKNNEKIDELNEKFSKTFELFNESYKKDLSNKSLVKLYEIMEDLILTEWKLEFINDVILNLNIEKLKKSKLKNAENLADEFVEYVSSIENMEQTKRFFELVFYINDTKRKQILNFMSINNLKQYFKNDVVFYKKIKRYIEDYSYSNLNEIKLEEKVSNNSIISLLEKILLYSQNADKFVKLKEIWNDRDDELYFNEEFKSLNDENKNIAKDITVGIENKSRFKQNVNKVYNIVRTIFLDIGNNFLEDGYMDNANDIFYFTKDEIFKFIMDNKYIDFKKVLEVRNPKYEKYNMLPSYSKLVFLGKTFDKSFKDPVILNPNIVDIVGIPCTDGEVSGEVVLESNFGSLKNIEDIDKKILVIKKLSSEILPLILFSKGVIIEENVKLYYIKRILEELNVVLIVGVNGATKLFKNGDRIKLEGSSGTINFIEKK